jgi:hypothetical protein
VYGTVINIEDTLYTRRKKSGLKILDVYEEFDQISNEAGLCYYNYNDFNTFIGLLPEDIGDNEIGFQFKERARKTINNAFGLKLKRSDLDWINEVISD